MKLQGQSHCNSRRGSGCGCGGGRIERFMEPCLLMLLLESPAHGYELLGRLNQFGLNPEEQDPGLLYKTLRRMEQDGFLSSRWDTDTAGPAKRLYEVTEEGIALVHSWAAVIKRNIRMLGDFVEAYRRHFGKEVE